MSTKQTSRQKPVDHCAAWGSDVELISEDTIQTLADEPGEGCRFAAIAKTYDSLGASYSFFGFAVTVVLYVDGSGRYGFERMFIGKHESWDEIPRTVAVPPEADIPDLPLKRQKAARQTLALYEDVEIEA